jgi:hypothetical protein
VTYRNRSLLDLAHLSPCHASFPHDCSEYQGVEPAHSDQQIWGRGHGHKSHDFAHAAMCHVAHMMLDTFDREQKQAEWLRAHIKTMAWYWENGYLVVNKKGRIAA